MRDPEGRLGVCQGVFGVLSELIARAMRTPSAQSLNPHLIVIISHVGRL